MKILGGGGGGARDRGVADSAIPGETSLSSDGGFVLRALVGYLVLATVFLGVGVGQIKPETPPGTGDSGWLQLAQ
jgi:hypothetical protein